MGICPYLMLGSKCGAGGSRGQAAIAGGGEEGRGEAAPRAERDTRRSPRPRSRLPPGPDPRAALRQGACRRNTHGAAANQVGLSPLNNRAASFFSLCAKRQAGANLDML